jgi:hypothetical protein
MSESERYRIALVQTTLLMAKLYKSKAEPEVVEPKKVEPKKFDFDVFMWSDVGELFRFLRGKFTQQRGKVLSA